MPTYTPSRIRHMVLASLHTLLQKGLKRLFSASFVPPIALLIDGDNNSNMSSELLAQILVEAGKFGGVTIRKVYGNWREPNMDRWKDLCSHYAIEPIYHMQTTMAGKNAADIALAIDALDLLRCQDITHFCLVASDSDYLPLVRRLREAGCFVIIIGKSSTLPILTHACNVFLAHEELIFKPLYLPKALPVESKQAISPSPSTTEQRILSDLLLRAYLQAVNNQKEEWISIQRFSAAIRQIDENFKPIDYHYKNYPLLIQAFPTIFETKRQKTGHLALRCLNSSPVNKKNS
ncbi:NYN domain-containing protein [Tengunoibacter tsumagoiensis]|uniref:HTH OST-type domain-containing protein n=1 Tax=Tengunoibacter tsumagoiensis TaxID=2014871 RepID=A0A402A5K8_9CHLR|nr:NYN domain-containing protein [Tengunoibacter tsumagoiensis]GCE14423.1 hypothetical protein KTT_42820 [Tengunoibacter tsumagoiensis]